MWVARWDLDKTYLRTEFDTLRDLLRTALERPDQKRTVPGAAALLREIGAAGARIHILSGSPEQLRHRIEEKLRLDGARWDRLTLKPNLRNILTLRLRAVRDQLGYKLPALLRARATLADQRDDDGALVREVLVGDDAESDAFVYSLYADVLSGAVGDAELETVMRLGHAYDDDIAEALRWARQVEKGDVVDRILIHLDRQSPPSDFQPYGQRVVPFFNYLQAAFVLEEAGRLPASSVVRVAIELVIEHRFDGEALARSYLDLARRGHLVGSGAEAIADAFHEMSRAAKLPAAREVETMCDRIARIAESAEPGAVSRRTPEYRRLVEGHSRRNAKGR